MRRKPDLVAMIALAFAGLVQVGCSDSATPASTISVEPVDDIALCPAGGNAIKIGVDQNGNGVLDAAEVVTTYPVCNGTGGANGTTAAVATSTLAAGDSNCPAGGTRVDSGLDQNGNSILDVDEIADTSYVCSGAVPDTLVSVNPSGSWVLDDEASRCPAGGTEVIAYIDENDNNVFENGIDTLLGNSALCSGESALVASAPLGAGDGNCPAGGTRIESGFDANGNGILDAAEVATTSYACNSAARTDTRPSGSWIFTPGEAVSCPVDGGTEIITYSDNNGNGVFDPATDSLLSRDFVCNGLNGKTGLVATTLLPLGDASCPAGGARLETGLDNNGNGILDAAEIASTTYTCNSATAVDTNPSGTWVLTPSEATSCISGGTEIISYTDNNANNVFNNGTDGLLSRDFICNGVDTLVATTALPVGDPQCANGGVRIDSGQDVNGSAVLDPAEINDSTYACTIASRVATHGSGAWVQLNEAASCPGGGTEIIGYVDNDSSNTYNGGDTLLSAEFTCNGVDGIDGADSLVKTAAFSGALNGCTDGGYQIDFGTDANNNGILDTAEITSTYFACNGSGGTPAGLNEGTAAAPVNVPVGPTPYLATVAAGGTSFYRFSTIDTGGRPAPYTARFNAQESVLDARFFSDAFATPLSVSCNPDPWSGNQWCATERLPSLSAVYLSAREIYLVPNQYFIGLAFGAVEGEQANPVDIGVITAGSLNATLSNYPAGPSYYTFTAANSGVHTMQVSNFFSDPSDPSPAGSQIFMSIYDSADNYVSSCTVPSDATATCLFSLPSAGAYELRTGHYESGAIYDISIVQGGSLLPQLWLNSYQTDLATPASETIPVDPSGMGTRHWYRVTTAANGELTILTEGSTNIPDWTLYDASLTSVYNCWFGNCSITGLAPNTDYYIEALPAWDVDTSLSAYDRSFGVTVDVSFDAANNYSALTTVGQYPYMSFFNFVNTNGYGSIELSIANAIFYPGSYVEVEIQQDGSPYSGCYLSTPSDTCVFSTTAGANYSLVFRSWDVATRFDLSLTGF